MDDKKNIKQARQKEEQTSSGTRQTKTKNYINKKSACKNFILKDGKSEDIQQVKSWLDERLKNDKK